ncbi:hypothetical protein X551_03449 [Methylibium sp. T29]|nr:hypothetical protein X551_03449 [Methylibium sp. T29]
MRRPDVDRRAKSRLNILRKQDAPEQGVEGEVDSRSDDEIAHQGCEGRLGARSESAPRPVVQDKECREPRHDHAVEPSDHDCEREDGLVRRRPAGQTRVDQQDVSEEGQHEAEQEPADTDPRLFQAQVDPGPMPHACAQDAPGVEADEDDHRSGGVASLPDIEGGVHYPVAVKQHARDDHREYGREQDPDRAADRLGAWAQPPELPEKGEEHHEQDRPEEHHPERLRIGFPRGVDRVGEDDPDQVACRHDDQQIHQREHGRAKPQPRRLLL